jgi:hypothetical protein
VQLEKRACDVVGTRRVNLDAWQRETGRTDQAPDVCQDVTRYAKEVGTANGR